MCCVCTSLNSYCVYFAILQAAHVQITHQELVSGYENHNNESGEFVDDNIFYVPQHITLWFTVFFLQRLIIEHLLTEEEEYYPRLSAKELAQQFEKTIEEAAPSKKIKASPV